MKNKVKTNLKKWVKIGSKASSFLARHNAVYKAINKYMKEISGIPIILDNYKYIEHTHYGSSSYPQEIECLYNRIHKKIGGVEGYIRLRRNEYREYLREIKKLVLKINNNITNKGLANLFLEADDLYARASSFLGLGTLYTDILCRKLYKKFGEKYLHFNFSAETKLSRYNEELFCLSKIKNKSRLQTEIRKVLKKYCWIGSLFFIGNELNKKQILEDIKNIQKPRDIVKQKKLFIPKDSLIKEMKLLSMDRNIELEEFMLGEYYFRKLLDKIAKRIKVDFETLVYFSPNEIVDCLYGKSIPTTNIKKRKILFGFLIKDGIVSEYYGKDAKFLIEHQLKKIDQVKKINQIKGVVACYSQKKIKGKVKIVYTSLDIKKVKKGNILVARMTTPNYISAIYKVSAIITDEGGITCHAAIISRELGIPCIIGTKIATQVLKDGDLVEVDADNGVVRIIKN